MLQSRASDALWEDDVLALDIWNDDDPGVTTAVARREVSQSDHSRMLASG